MIYITGDTHGEIDIHKLSLRQWRDSCNLTRSDYLIILGDFGLPFLDSDVTDQNQPAKGAYRYWIKWLSEKPYTILWIDGNHDNFNYWEKQPITEWHGGKVQVHPHAPNIIHLMRGEIYDIEGKTFLAFGGAASTDKGYRICDFNWWSQEEANQAEIDNARENLSKHNNYVDYILTHTLPREIISTIPMISYKDIPDKTAEFLNEVLEKVNYDMWFCGHFHMEAFMSKINIFIFYNKILGLDECEDIKKQYENKGE